MKLLILLPSIACLVFVVGAQDPTDPPTQAPESTPSPATTADPESTTGSSTLSTETSELTTIALPDSTTSSITDEPSSTDPSTMTSEAPVETTTAVNDTSEGNSTVCKDSTPALCKSFFQLCQAPKHCHGKKGESHENSKEGSKQDEKNTEESEKRIKPTEGVESDEDSDDNEEVICAWVRMQPHPELQEISAKCNQENAVTQRQFIRDGLFGGRLGPKLPKKPRGNQKRLDCRLQKAAFVYFQFFCPATCNVC
uniref:Uncharacterized protein n=1 Tax=Plectus sambesii TaxID=2011161 RepID=A0A914VSD8_9BILA